MDNPMQEDWCKHRRIQSSLLAFNACDPAGRDRGAWGVSQHAHMERWTVQRYGIVGTAKEHGTTSMQGTIHSMLSLPAMLQVVWNM